jgi:hypothetical protein
MNKPRYANATCRLLVTDVATGESVYSSVTTASTTVPRKDHVFATPGTTTSPGPTANSS